MSNVGIYKITSPSNKVYVGQSWDIYRRVWNYKKLRCEGQRHLYSSINKYGWDNHTFKVIHELPDDVTQAIFDVYEELYMSQYKECGIQLLNIRSAGSKGKLAQETIEKMRLANIGKKASEDTKKKMSEARKGKIMSDETIKKILATRKEKGITMSKEAIEKGIPTRFKKGLSVWNKGKTNVYTADHLAKMRLRKASQSTREKIKAARAKQIMPKGRKHSDESKLKMSESAKKRGYNLPKGYVHSEATRKKLSESHKDKPSPMKGKKFSEEVRKNMSLAAKKVWEDKKLNNGK